MPPWNRLNWVIWSTNSFSVTNTVFWIINIVFRVIWLILSNFSMFSQLTPCSPIPDGRMEQKPKHVSTVCWYIESINVHKVCYTHPLKSFSTLPQSSNALCSANCFSSLPSITPCAYWCAMHPYISCPYPLLNICAHHFPKELRSESRRCPHSAHCVLCAVYFSAQPNKLRPMYLKI